MPLHAAAPGNFTLAVPALFIYCVNEYRNGLTNLGLIDLKHHRLLSEHNFLAPGRGNGPIHGV